MNLFNYIFTNTLTIRWWMRRCALAIFGVSIIWIIIWTIFVDQWLDTDRVISLLNTSEVTAQIEKISSVLSGDQYITISAASGFVTNKTWVWFEDANSILEVSLDTSCEDWFTTSTKQWWLITNKSVCFNSKSKQQVVTWAQIMSGASYDDSWSNAELGDFIARYPSLGSVISGGIINITADTLQAIESDIKAMRQDPVLIWSLTEAISSISMMMLVPLWFVALFFAMVMTIVLLVWLIIYSLITRAIAGIMKYDITFEQAFSLSWLPWLLIKIWWSLIWLDWAIRVLLWIIMIVWIIYYHKQQQTPTTSE